MEEWKLPTTNIRTTLSKNFNKNNFGNLHKTNFRTTGFSKDRKAGVPTSMAAPTMVAIKLLKMVFSKDYEETKRLISLLDLLDRRERDERKRLHEIPC